MAANADDPIRIAPLPGPIDRAFEPAEPNWMAGHRGVDIRGDEGDSVVAAAAGTVAWIGVIDSVPMISIQHPDGLRTTYQPVEAVVGLNEEVTVGQTIGRLVDGHCEDGSCLHWGLREGDRYLDPMSWLSETALSSSREVRLLPLDATPRQMPAIGSAEAADVATAPGGMVDPVDGLPSPGPITSPYGYRNNPISGASELHDGIDIGSPCGTPVASHAAGTVTSAGEAGGFGLRVEVDHGTVNGQPRGSSYSHLESIAVNVGQSVQTGSIVGYVGTTGYSTGCHLHYSITVNGATVDPLSVI